MNRPGSGNTELTQEQHYGALARAIRDVVPKLRTPEIQEELRSLADACERLATGALALSPRLEPPRPPVISFRALNVVASLGPLAASELKAGETYDSWRCQVCNSVLALAPRVPDANPLDLPNAIVRLKCPQCGARRHYTIHDRLARRYPWDAKIARA